MSSDSPQAQALINAARAEHGGEVVEAFAPKLTDIGNGERFVTRHGDNVRHCADWGKDQGWAVWFTPPAHPTGGWWKRDNLGAVNELAKETAISIATEDSLPPRDLDKTEWRKALRAFSHESSQSGPLSAMLKMAKSDPRIAIAADIFDKDPMLFNFQNGTLDLRTSEFREARREDYITKAAATDYDPAAVNDIWEAFMSLIQPSEEEQEFLQRACAYSMSGTTTYPEAFFALVGGAGTGKSTFTDTILEIFGDYGKVVPTFMLMQQRNEDRKNEIAWMRDARICIAGETDEKAKISVATIKSMTGGDRQVGRRLHEQYSQSKPTYKLWLHTNHPPDPGVNDIGYFDRLKLVRFDQRIRDGAGAAALRELCGMRNIKEVLIENKAGIVNWILRGLKPWRENGLGTTEAVRAAVAALQAEADRLGTFLTECVVKESGAECPVGDLWNKWKGWCDESNVPPRDIGGKIKFGARLKELGFVQPDHAKGGKSRVWLGLRLRQAGESGEAEPSSLGHGKQWKHPDGEKDNLF